MVVGAIGEENQILLRKPLLPNNVSPYYGIEILKVYYNAVYTKGGEGNVMFSFILIPWSHITF
jgi:hypothetical protein